jgi:hypothetical protein
MQKSLKLFSILVCILSFSFVTEARAQGEVISASDLVFAALRSSNGKPSVGSELDFDKLIDKFITVSGLVTEAPSKDTSGDYHMTLYGYGLGGDMEHYSGINLSLLPSDLDSFTSIKSGAEVIIKGRCVGRGNGNSIHYLALRQLVLMDNCFLIEHTPKK